MFQVGDRVVYGVQGVCRITGEEKRVVDRKNVTYLVLVPEGSGGSQYLVPTHNTVAMGKLSALLSAGEMEALLRSQQVRADGWIADESRRKQYYRELIGSGNREKLMQMICTLYRHRASQNAAGKKVHMCDENFLRDAERLLMGEVAYTMDMPQDEAKRYIREMLKPE